MGKRKINSVKKFISIFLSFMMIFTALPMEILAGTGDEVTVGSIAGIVRINGEAEGLPDHQVKLYLDDSELGSTKTDGNGTYLFSMLPVGNYTVEAVKTAEVIDSVKSNPIFLEEGFQINDMNLDLEAIEASVAEDVVPVEAEAPSELAVTEEPVVAEVYANRITGSLWLDTHEAIDNGVYSGDGIRQAEEQGLSGYMVSLYKAEDKSTPVQSVTTDGNGVYGFENIKPGSYVVGITSITMDEVEYLLPIAGITGDNKFSDFSEDSTTIFSEPITVSEDTIVEGINGGLRTPPGVTQRVNWACSNVTVTNISGTSVRIQGTVTATNSCMGVSFKYVDMDSVPVTVSPVVSQVYFNNGTRDFTGIVSGLIPNRNYKFSLEPWERPGEGTGIVFQYTTGVTKTSYNVNVNFDAKYGANPGARTYLPSHNFNSLGALPLPTRPGHTFAGWWTAASGGTQVFDGSNVGAVYPNSAQSDLNVTLHARWNVNNNTVAFNVQGGTPQPGNITRQSTQALDALPTPTRAGYTFAGWWTAASGGVQASATSTPIGLNSSLGANGTLTLYARWNENNNTVAFNVQGGTPQPGNITRQSTQAIGTLPTVTRAGHTFAGWWTAPSGGVQASAASTPIGLNGSLGASATITLYARWSVNNNTVAFDVQGGTPGAASISRQSTQAIGALPTVTKSGYTFAGWWTETSGGTQASATSTPIGLNGSLGANGTITLYARWTENGHTVVFDAQGGDSTPASLTRLGNQQLGALETTNRANYTFDGWFTEPTGGTQASATSTPGVLNPSLGNGGVLTLYAQWTPVNYNIQVNYETRDGGFVAGATDFSVTKGFGTTYSPTAGELAITDYILVDWLIDGVSQGNAIPSMVVPATNTTITLVYGQDKNNNGIEDVTFTVKHATTAGVPIGTDRAVTLDVGLIFNDGATTIIGYTYNNTYTDQAGSIQMGIPNFAVSVGDQGKEITYGYTINEHEINVYVVDRDGNSINGGAYDLTGISKDFAESFTASTPAITDYVFADWKNGIAGVLEGNLVPNVTMPDADVDIYLVYGQDLDNNGTEDVTFTVKHTTIAGVGIGTDSQVIKNIGDLFNAAADSINGYTYNNTYIDQAGNPQTGLPNFTVALGDRNTELVYEYTVNSNTINVYVVDRDGNSIGSGIHDVTGISKNFGESFTAATPAITNYIFADWKVGNGSLEGNTIPTITIPNNGVDIYLVYGQDNDNNGVEDVTFTVKHATVGGSSIGTDRAVTKNIGETFNDAADAVTGYTTNGTYVDQAGNNQTGIPNFTVALSDRNKDVTYEYTANTHMINVYAVDRDGNSINGGAHDVTGISKDFAESFTASTPWITDYVFADWKNGVAGSLEGNTNPTITMPDADVDIYLVYGQDSNNNGIEDVTFTVKHATTAGVAIGTDRDVTLDIGETFNDAADAVTGYTYNSTYTDQSGAIQMGIPNFTVSLSDRNQSIIYGYTANTHTINVHAIDRDGNSIAGGAHDVLGISKDFAESFTATDPAITNYVFADWKTGAIGLQGNTNPTITMPDADVDIYLVYGQDSDNNGVEDVTFTVKHKTVGGVAVGTDRSVTKNIGETFNDGSATITGHTYNNSYIDKDGNVQSGIPNFTVALANRNTDVVYEYTVNTYTVTIKHEMRDGTAISSAADIVLTQSFGDTVTPTTALLDHLFVDWKLDGTLQGNTTPSITVSDDTTITLVYGQDKNNNGIEDFTITVKHETQAGGMLIADDEVIVDINGTYTGDVDSGLVASGYTFVEYVWDTDPASTTVPVTKTGITADHTIVFKYTPNEYPVNVTYEYEANNGTVTALPGNESAQIIHGTTFTPNIPTFSQKTLIGWTLDGVVQSGTPNVSSVERFHIIVLIYGQDMDGDGVRDYTITETCSCSVSGNPLHSRVVYVSENTNYTVKPQSFTHHVYAGYSVDGGPMQIANPNNPQIASVNEDHDVKILYGHASYSVNVKVVDSNGNAIGSNSYSVNKAYQESFSAPVSMLQGYDFVKWQLNGVDQSGNAPTISSVDGNKTITIVYKAKAKPPVNPPVGPTDPETPINPETGEPDYGNYEFIKKPNVKNVGAGETVDYSFSGFGNKHPIALENYEIVDKPDRGLDFVSASLPAFKNGDSVTYTIQYKTNKGDFKTLHENVFAGQAFSFKAPVLGDGEYITNISLRFGTVPAGFAVGDTMTMTFKVWDNPPAEVLTNVGYLFYKVDGKDMQFVTGGDGTAITIGGWFSGPGTGDSSQLPMNIGLALVAGFGLILIPIVRRRKYNTRKIS